MRLRKNKIILKNEIKKSLYPLILRNNSSIECIILFVINFISEK